MKESETKRENDHNVHEEDKEDDDDRENRDGNDVRKQLLVKASSSLPSESSAGDIWVKSWDCNVEDKANDPTNDQKHKTQ